VAIMAPLRFDRLAQDGAQLPWCAAARIAEVDLVVAAAGTISGGSDGLVDTDDGRPFARVGTDVQQSRTSPQRW
jgi:hypothetical protein